MASFLVITLHQITSVLQQECQVAFFLRLTAVSNTCLDASDLSNVCKFSRQKSASQFHVVHYFVVRTFGIQVEFFFVFWIQLICGNILEIMLPLEHNGLPYDYDMRG